MPLELHGRPEHDDERSTLSADLAQVRVETLPVPAACGAQLSDLAAAGTRARLREDHAELPDRVEAEEQLAAPCSDCADAIQKPDEPMVMAAGDETRTTLASDEQREPTLEYALDRVLASTTPAAAADGGNSRPGMQGVNSSADLSLGAAGSRLMSHAPLLVSLLLGALIIAELAHASYLLLGSAPSEAQSPLLVPSTATSQPKGMDVRGIVSAHLFGEAAQDSSTEKAANSRQAAANLLLAGTLATQDPNHGYAIINRDGHAKAYQTGETVADGELHSVFRDHVVFQRRGILETLYFPQGLSANGIGTSLLRPAVQSAIAPLTGAQGEQDNLGEWFSGNPILDGNGNLRGFRIFPSGNNRLSDPRPSDLIVSINGTSLAGQDPKTGREIFNSLKGLTQATLTVERAGERHDITVTTAPGDAKEEVAATDQ